MRNNNNNALQSQQKETEKTSSPSTASNTSSSISSKSSSNTVKENQLSGMDLVNYKCRRKKRRYDKCISNWYSKEFLTGKSMGQEEECGDKFEAYRTCVLRGIKIEVWDKEGLPPPKEGSPLAEIDDDDAGGGSGGG